MRVLYINNDGGGFADHVEVDDGSTIAQFCKTHDIKETANYLIRVNRQPATADQILLNGDRISITPVKIDGANKDTK